MATEKRLLSRIQLRYDTYANWTSTTLGDGKGANLVLKAGEVGICSIPAGVSADGVQNPPHVMFKVGDGTSAFSALSWTSAKAADVYAWAKQASLPVSTEGTGNAVTAVAWDEASKGLKVTLGEKFATSAELKAVADNVAALNDTFATDKELSDAVSAINTEIAKKADKTYVDDELAKKVNNTDFETFKGENTTAIGNAKDAAIAAAKTETENQIKALNVTDTAVDGEYVSAVNEVEGKIVVSRKALPVDTLVTGSANGTVAFNGTDVAVKGLASAAYVTVDSLNTTAKGYADAAQSAAEGKVTELANGAVKANTEAIEAMKNGETGILAEAKAYADTAAGNALTSAQGYADQAELDAISSANGYTDQEIGKVNDAIADVIDGTTPVAKATDADKLGGVVAADYATKAYVDQAELDAIASAKTYTDEVKKAILTGESTTELKAAYDTLVEIQEWIEGAGVNATELTEAIAEEARLRGEADTALGQRIDGLLNGDGKVAEAAEADHADVASSLDEAGLAQVKGVKVDNATHADAAGKVDNALTVTLEDGNSVVYDGSAAKSFDLTGLATKAYADQAEADAISTAAGDATAKANKALEDAKAYADGIGSGSLDDAKAYADGLIEALDYTDAAVAGKYVSAVQEVNGKIEVSRADLPTYALTSGSVNGSVAFNGSDVAVTGLKSAAYTESSSYATAAQGALADSALQKADITTGSANGTIAVEGTDVAVKGLGSAAYTETSAYATAAQGAKADTALQSVEVGTGLKVSTKAENKQTIEFDEEVIFVLYGGTASEVI